MAAKKRPDPSANKNISINGNVKDSVVISGDNNTVNQTIIQKIINIFKSDSETLEQRNRRILLGHVENAWIKGVLDASLHGAALLDLGIKQDPEAVTKYPWAIKKESTDETLPTGTSMLDIFDSIGMGRSLLILGAPGSGKTTMLLELARQLIQHAREDVTYPIPMVFNLSSWTESKTLADWLAQELNNLYSVPRKTAPDWVKGNKLLLLLDGLDEVRQESRTKCVEVINAFRKEHGLTSLAVCSRSQDYADLNAKLSFEGAIEVQPLTQEQITEFFNRFGKEMAGIKQVLKKDSALREMAETPLFLSIMLMAYRDKQGVDIWISQDEKMQRKHLFDTYIERMFERPRSKNANFQKRNVLHWLSWLANKIVKHNKTPYLIEEMQPDWLEDEKQVLRYRLIVDLSSGLLWGMFCGLMSGLMTGPFFGLIVGLILGPLVMHISARLDNPSVEHGDRTTFSAKGFFFTAKKPLLVVDLIYGLIGGLAGLMGGLSSRSISGSCAVLILGTLTGWIGTTAIDLINNHTLRFLLARNNLLPWRLVPFLDHCVDLIFLRRVGGGYIFIHRLLMEHFAEMYVEIPTSKRNQK